MKHHGGTLRREIPAPLLLATERLSQQERGED